MTLDAEARRARADLKRKIKEIERPEWLAKKAERKRQRQEMVKRVGKRETGQRQPRERDPGYLAYLRRQPCRIGLVAPGTCDGRIEACHVRYSDVKRGKVNAGLQAKPSDRWATSCCSGHHVEQHARGDERAWWASYGLDGLDEAEKQFAEYKSDGSVVDRRMK